MAESVWEQSQKLFIRPLLWCTNEALVWIWVWSLTDGKPGGSHHFSILLLFLHLLA